jgi:hypothetical protein
MTPTMCWALFVYDAAIKEKRLVAVYSDGADANIDALALTNATQQPTVELFEIQNSPQFTSVEPALEESAADFDTPIHVSGEVN